MVEKASECVSNGTYYVGNLYRRIQNDGGAFTVIGRRNRPIHVLCIVALLSSSCMMAAGDVIENGIKTDKDVRELLPKVWVPDPQGATREASGLDSWYDPSKDALVPSTLFQMFKTRASWTLPGRIYRKNLALRVWDDDNTYLMDEREFCEKVGRILKSRVPIMENNNHAKQVFECLDDIGEFSTNAISVHIKIDNYHQLIGMKGTGLLSKRYLNVDGRFFYIGVVSEVMEREVNTCAFQNEKLLKAWEQDIRRCTWVHRLSEHGGDTEAAARAISGELLAGKDRKEKDPSSLPMNKRIELARRLMADRRYNSTNKPSEDALRQILFEAGLGGKAGSKEVQPHSASTRPGERHDRTPEVGGLIVMVFVILFIVIACMCRSASGKDVARN